MRTHIMRYEGREFSIAKVMLLFVTLSLSSHSALAQVEIQPTAQMPQTEKQESRVVTSPSSFGVIFGMSADVHHANFQYLPGYVGCSPFFTGGTGVTRSLGLTYAYRLSSPSSNMVTQQAVGTSANGSHVWDGFKIGANVVFNPSSATLLTHEGTTISENGVASPATIDHMIDVSVSSITGQLYLGYQLFPSFDVIAGGELGYITSATFHSNETLATPAQGAFENGSRIRNAQSGSLPNINTLQRGVLAGLQYSLPLNALNTMKLVPSAMYHVGFSNLITGLPWKHNGFSGALGIEYQPQHTIQPPHRDTIKVEPVPPKPPVLLASITASGVDSSGTEERAFRLRVEEFYEVTLVPVIPYVFFDENEAAIPERYHALNGSSADGGGDSRELFRSGFTRSARTTAQGPDRIELHRDILNIIGSRLSDHERASLTITGTSNGAEQNGKTLAIERANAVKQYLATAWKIDPSRLRVLSRDLPEHPSPVENPDGRTENCRVEFASNDQSILSPLVIGDTVRTATPSSVRFRPTVKADRSLAAWKIEVEQDHRLLKTYSGAGNPPSAIDWIVADDQAHVPQAPGELQYGFAVRDIDGDSTAASGRLPVEQITVREKKRQIAHTTNGDAEIERFSLLLFDFNSAQLSSENREALNEIRTHIRKGSIVTVAGYADRIGELEFNQKIADERAKVTAEALGLPVTTVKPYDGRTLLYNNNLPEGRVYSRTVEITIRTPANDQE